MSAVLNVIKKFFTVSQINAENNRAKYYFYKIVDNQKKDFEYILQCINTKNIFYASITDIVFDKNFLSSLMPEQACYIGIQFVKYINEHKEILHKKLKPKWSDYLTSRYGQYKMCWEDRINNLGFINKFTGEEYLMDPRDVALTESLIKDFDALQAFYIGFLAGLKLRDVTIEKEKSSSLKSKPHVFLKVIK